MSAVESMDLSAEEAVIGAMLVNGAAIERVQEHVSKDDFYNLGYGILFGAAVAMHDRNDPVDPVSLKFEIEKLGKVNETGGEATIHALAQMVTASSNATHHAKIVRECAIRRGLSRAGMSIRDLGDDPAGDVDEKLHQAEEFLSSVTLRNRTASTTLLNDGLDEYVDELREAFGSGVAKTGLLTGYPLLDAITMGMWPGQFIVFAARPGQGKSTLAFNIAENLADREVPSLFVSLEMGKNELRERALARAARADGYNLRSGQLTNPESQRLAGGIETVKKRGGIMFVNDDGYMTLPMLKAEATRLQRVEGIQAVFVDYIQLMTPPKAETRNLEIAEISRGLKLLARKLDLPIVACAQMSRAIESRGGVDRRPQLSDLRDSGALEQDADVVVFLHDQSSYDIDKEPDGTIDVIVEKNRKGRTDVAKMGFVRKYNSFVHFPEKGETE
jgi:replicative DNA helicase